MCLLRKMTYGEFSEFVREKNNITSMYMADGCMDGGVYVNNEHST